MPARSYLLTGPVPLVAGPTVANLAALVAADVLVRRARADGQRLCWLGAAMAGGLTAQRAVEDDLIREGLDKATLGRAVYATRAAAAAGASCGRLGALTTALGLGFDAPAAAAAGDATAAAARTAFVRLFDAGLMTEAERVVGTCPRCLSTVAATEAVEVLLAGQLLTLRLGLVGGPDPAGHLDVRCAAPELLAGVVAVAVPPGLPGAATAASIPVAATVVPLVVDDAVDEPTLVVPAHDPAALDVARRLGLLPVPVIDADGHVRGDGPLSGLARHAARAAARRMLEAEGAVVEAAPHRERVQRCPACATVLVPLLRRQWFLPMDDLERAAADAVRDDRVALTGAAREDVLARAGATGEWCVTQQVWAGTPVPVARCLDCGHIEVSVHMAPSCGRCMGDLAPDEDVLDARFVRTVWPLASAGWPEGPKGQATRTGSGTLLVMSSESSDEVLTMLALGLRLSGAVPFDEVVFLPPCGGGPPGPGERPPADAPSLDDLSALVASEGAAVVRVALTGAGLDVAGARDLADRLANPPVGGADVDRLAASVAGAFASSAPAAAVALLEAAVAEGVPAGGAERVRVLAGPFLGT